MTNIDTQAQLMAESQAAQRQAESASAAAQRMLDDQDSAGGEVGS